MKVQPRHTRRPMQTARASWAMGKARAGVPVVVTAARSDASAGGTGGEGGEGGGGHGGSAGVWMLVV